VATPSLGDEPADDDEGENTVFIKSTPPAAEDASYRTFVLRARSPAGPIIAGGLILRIPPGNRAILAAELLDSVGDALHEQYGGTSILGY
jgi:hypothetical protein